MPLYDAGMTIPPRFLDEIRSRLTLSEIIGRRIKVTRAGREYKACCPFHNEKTPSFTINDQKGFYHCFGCGAHGDVVNFVIEHDNLSFPEAVELLATQAGLQVPEQSPAQIQKAKQEKSIHQLLSDTSKWFEEQLRAPENREKLEYLTGRGLREETINAFHIGFSPENGQLLRQYLASQGYTDKQMISAGVLKASTRGGEPYAFFRERIMFPVADKRGRIVAFGGRVLPDHLRSPSRGDFTPPKYINSSDNPVFHKGSVLYSESLARQHVYDMRVHDKAKTLGALVVVEGYMDVIAAAQAGFKGAVAPMGTALTEDQIMALWRMIPEEDAQTAEPVLCFDGDNAGRRAAERAAERILPLLAPGRSARFSFLPQGEDPDSLIKGGGPGAFEKILGASMPLIDFLIEKYTAGRVFDTPESRAGLRKVLMRDIEQIPDRDVQGHYKSLIHEKLSKIFYPNRGNGGRAGAGGRGQGGATGGAAGLSLKRPVVNKSYMLERILLACVINHPALYRNIEDQLGHMQCRSPEHERIRQRLISFFEMHDDEEAGLDSSDIHTYFTDIGMQKEKDDITSVNVYNHAAFAAPHYDRADQLQKWMQIFNELAEQSVTNEIQQGWRDVMASNDTQDEQRLMHMMQTKKTVLDD